jgi:hypothetical protein
MSTTTRAPQTLTFNIAGRVRKIVFGQHLRRKRRRFQLLQREAGIGKVRLLRSKQATGRLLVRGRGMRRSGKGHGQKGRRRRGVHRKRKQHGTGAMYLAMYAIVLFVCQSK